MNVFAKYSKFSKGNNASLVPKSLRTENGNNEWMGYVGRSGGYVSYRDANASKIIVYGKVRH